MLYCIVDICLAKGLRPRVVAGKVRIRRVRIAVAIIIISAPASLVGAIGDGGAGVVVRIADSVHSIRTMSVVMLMFVV